MSGRFSVRALIAAVGLCLSLVVLGGSASAVPPVVVMGTVTSPGYDTAHVTGEVDPKGEPTSYSFEVSTDGTNWQPGNFGGEFTEEHPPVGLQHVEGDLQGLKPGTTYKVRLTAFNSNEFNFISSEAPYPEVTTKSLASPSVEISPVAAITASTATFSGHIDTNTPPDEPAAADAHWHFECTPECPGLEGTVTAAEGEADVEVEAKGLQPNTDYEVSLVAKNAGDPVSDGPASFKTDELPPPTITVDPVTTFTATTAHLSGLITPNTPTPGDPSASDVQWHFQCTPECPGLSGEQTVSGTKASEAVTAEAEGLEPNTTYEVRLVGHNVAHEVSGGPVSFKTAAAEPSAATIPAFVLEGGKAALLGGRINPHNSATEYWFEYGTTSAYGASVPATEDASAGSAGAPRVLTQEVANLEAGTTYHFRVVAKNGQGTVEGDDTTFTTPVPASAEGKCSNEEFRVGPSATLPECRAYELASLSDIGGPSVHMTAFQSNEQPWSPIAADGEALLWETDAILPGANTYGWGTLMLARRGADGWHNEYVGMPNPPFERVEELSYADPELNRFIFKNEGNVYRREPNGSFERITQGASASTGRAHIALALRASRDATRVAFSYDTVLEPGAPSEAIYSRSGNTTTTVSLGAPGASLSPYATSTDGKTIAFGSTAASLYLRVDLTETIPISVAPIQDINLAFGSLSDDGQTMYFVAGEPLTADDTDESADVFAFHLATRTITRVSAPSGSPSSGPGNSDSCPSSWSGSCNARFVAASPDGSRAYFVSPEQLDGDRGVVGAPNLYLREGSSTKFLTTLDPGDPELKGSNERKVIFTPDDSKLVFQSSARVTAFPNDGNPELYEHDPSTGQIFCVSCSPDATPALGGAQLYERPVGNANLDAPYEAMLPPTTNDDGSKVFFKTRDALLPGDTNYVADVYEFDVRSGVTSLISTGTGDVDTSLWGVGGNGRDVIIESNQRLTAEDGSQGSSKVWDVRVGGGFPAGIESPPPPSCQGDGCHGSASSGSPEVRASTPNLIGPGNPKPPRKKCRKGTVAKHGKCVKKKSRKHKRRHRTSSSRHGGKTNGSGRATR